MDKEFRLKCPVCGQALSRDEHTLKCPKRHSFDKAAAGYVNLLPSGGKPGKIHGDSPEMVMARRRFLSAGYYSCLRERLYTEVTSAVDGTSVFLDAGCGEGYYTNAFDGYFSVGIGVDISKDAVRRAAKGARNIQYCAASIFNLPVFDASVDVLTSVFAPYSAEEFARVLSPGGYVYAVVPGREHLWGLKEKLYEAPYPNDECGYTLPGFELVSSVRAEESICVAGQDIPDLFKMTPYYWKTGKETSQRLLSQAWLETRISFVIYRYQKL